MGYFWTRTSCHAEDEDETGTRRCSRPPEKGGHADGQHVDGRAHMHGWPDRRTNPEGRKPARWDED